MSERERPPAANRGADISRPTSASTVPENWWPDLEYPTHPPCPPEHVARLQAAGVELCEEHGCPLCWCLHRDFCQRCQLLAVALAEAEGPVEDPHCMVHGLATAANRRSCLFCDTAVRSARRKGWQQPTGHDGVDCTPHCEVCGLCRGTGRVCRECSRCPDHPGGYDDACTGVIWDHYARCEVEFKFHTYWDLQTRRWAS